MLSNFDLENMARDFGIPITVGCEDEIPVKPGNFIMNMETSDQGGSHWVALLVSGKKVFYSDSFSGPPPQPLFQRFRAKGYTFYMNDNWFQDLKSEDCGLFAFFFLLYMNYSKPSLQALKAFQGFWNYKNRKQNDERVKAYLRTYPKK